MGLFDSLLGVGKLVANVIGGGSGSKTTTSGTQSQRGTSNTTGTTQASRREFSDGMLQALEMGAANALVGASQGTDRLTSQLEKVKGANLGGKQIQFDADAYIRDTMRAADNTLGASLRENRNQAIASAGGSTAGNSAAALLANRLEGDVSAQRAGIMASTTATAKELESNIQRANADALSAETSLLTGLDSNLQAGLATLLNALRGGETYQEVIESSRTNSTQSGSSASTSKTPFNWTAGLGNLFKDVGQD